MISHISSVTKVIMAGFRESLTLQSIITPLTHETGTPKIEKNFGC